MITRKPISSLFGLSLTVRAPTVNEPEAIRHDQLVVARRDNGAAVAFVDRDGLFDRDGNFFANDA